MRRNSRGKGPFPPPKPGKQVPTPHIKPFKSRVLRFTPEKAADYRNADNE